MGKLWYLGRAVCVWGGSIGWGVKLLRRVGKVVGKKFANNFRTTNLSNKAQKENLPDAVANNETQKFDFGKPTRQPTETKKQKLKNARKNVADSSSWPDSMICSTQRFNFLVRRRTASQTQLQARIESDSITNM